MSRGAMMLTYLLAGAVPASIAYAIHQDLTTHPNPEPLTMPHAAAPYTAHSVSTALTADGQVQDRTPANLTGAGFITGYDLAGAANDVFLVHDVNGSGAVLLDVKLGVTAQQHVMLPPESWIRYTSGCYVNGPASGGRAVIYYRAD